MWRKGPGKERHVLPVAGGEIFASGDVNDSQGFDPQVYRARRMCTRICARFLVPCEVNVDASIANFATHWQALAWLLKQDGQSLSIAKKTIMLRADVPNVLPREWNDFRERRELQDACKRRWEESRMEWRFAADEGVRKFLPKWIQRHCEEATVTGNCTVIAKNTAVSGELFCSSPTSASPMANFCTSFFSLLKSTWLYWGWMFTMERGTRDQRSVRNWIIHTTLVASIAPSWQFVLIEALHFHSLPLEIVLKKKAIRMPRTHTLFDLWV